MSNKQNDELLEWLFEKELEQTKDPDMAMVAAERKFYDNE